jgi:hypothetical protein
MATRTPVQDTREVSLVDATAHGLELVQSRTCSGSVLWAWRGQGGFRTRPFFTRDEAMAFMAGWLQRHPTLA